MTKEEDLEKELNEVIKKLGSKKEEVYQKEERLIREAIIKEKERLIRKWNCGHDCEVIWEQTSPFERTKVVTFTRSREKPRRVQAEVIDNKIFIYLTVADGLDKILKVLRHEFFEYILKDILKYYCTLIDTYRGILNRMGYDKKEEILEKLVKEETKDYERLKRNNS